MCLLCSSLYATRGEKPRRNKNMNRSKRTKMPRPFAGDLNYPKRETVCIGFLIQLFCECFVELKIILPRSRLKSFFSQCAKLSLKINVAVVFLIIEAGHLLPSYIHILPKGFGTWKRFIAVQRNENLGLYNYEHHFPVLSSGSILCSIEPSKLCYINRMYDL